MKTLPKMILTLTAIALLLNSCKKDSSSSPDASKPLTSGTWKVSYFYDDSDGNLTSQFAGYVFTFGTSGTVTATDSMGTENGTWKVDDSSNEFKITLGTTDPLQRVGKNWGVKSASDTEVDLIDDSGSSEELHFAKL